MTVLRVPTDDGWSLAVEHLPARGEPRGVCVCGHAMFCNRRTLDRPAGEGLGSVLASLGLHTYLVDFRGHGESGPAASRTVDFTYDDVILSDIPAVVRAVHERHPTLPLALVGHSLGGHGGVAAVAADRSLPVDALVSLAGNVWIPSLEPDALMWAGKRATSEAWWATTEVAGVFPARRLGVGTDDEARSYVRQLVLNARRDRWASIDLRHDYLREMAHLRVPILSVVGAADTWMCTPLCARLWLAHAIRAPVTYRVISDPDGIDHMRLVIDPRMRDAWADIAEWVLRTFGD